MLFMFMFITGGVHGNGCLFYTPSSSVIGLSESEPDNLADDLMVRICLEKQDRSRRRFNCGKITHKATI